MTFSSPAVATSHYLGKTHAKNMKQQAPKVEGMSVFMLSQRADEMFVETQCELL